MGRARPRAAALTAVLGCVVAVAGGCGIGPQRSPDPIQPPAGVRVTTPSPPPKPAAAGRNPEYLYFIRDSMVVRVTRHVVGKPTPDMLVKDLLAGPNEAETAAGYTSALLGDSVVDKVTISGGHAVVALASLVGRNDEVLAYAQLVCTLTALHAVSGVTFTSAGKPVAVPRGDGSLSQAPLTAADYTDMVGK